MLVEVDAAPQVPLDLRPLEEFSGSLAARVYASLRAGIIGLSLAPGALLPKPGICAHFGVSRSPVSEAIARLAAEGLVRVAPQAGSYVAPLSMAEIREGAFLREALELAAAEAVAQTAGAADVERLNRNLRLQEAHVAAGDLIGYHAADAEMHEIILDATGHRRLAALSRTSWAHVDRARRLTLPHPGRVAKTLEEHRAIVAAIAARDPVAARAAVRHHLRQLLLLVEPLAIERPDLFA